MPFGNCDACKLNNSTPSSIITAFTMLPLVLMSFNADLCCVRGKLNSRLLPRCLTFNSPFG